MSNKLKINTITKNTDFLKMPNDIFIDEELNENSLSRIVDESFWVPWSCYTDKYLSECKNHVNTELIDGFQEFLNEYCLGKKVLLNKDEYDIEKGLEKLYKECCSENICRINYEK